MAFMQSKEQLKALKAQRAAAEAKAAEDAARQIAKQARLSHSLAVFLCIRLQSWSCKGLISTQPQLQWQQRILDRISCYYTECLSGGLQQDKH